MALNIVETAHNALVAALQASTADVFDGLTVTRDAVLPGDEVPAFLNVVRNPQPAQVLAEQLGLGEDAIVTEWVQVFDVEWIARANDETARVQAFSDGLVAIAAALHADRSLGGAAGGLVIGPPDYEDNRFSGAIDAKAAAIPVRVSLRGLSPIS